MVAAFMSLGLNRWLCQELKRHPSRLLFMIVNGSGQIAPKTAHDHGWPPQRRGRRGFFTVLGYAPFPMALSPIKLGLVFTGWGIFVAIFAVFGAPRLQASLGIAKTMYANLAAFAVMVLVIAIWTTDRAVLIPAVIISGIFIGVNNTVTTQAVMTVSPVEKPIASAAYSFVRFIGGGLAPYAAARMVLAVNIHFPFYIAVGAILLGIAVLATAHGLLTQAERVQA